ncbi:MAG: hypothetical protein ABWY11_00220 [Umezawaea sp.]
MTSAWPFLVGRTRNAGHRVVVAPDFMIAAGTTASLTRISRGPDTPEGEVVVDLLDGGLMVVSRVFVGDRADYGVEGDGPLRDGSGRAIRLTEGLVFRGDSRQITPADLARGHETAAAAFRRFWAEENDHEVEGSTGFRLTGSGGAPAPEKRTSRRLLGGLSALALVGAAVIGVAQLTGEDPPPPVVTVTRTAPVPAAECATPTPSCLVSPSELVTDAAIVIDAPNAVVTPGADCANDRGTGLHLVWAKSAGSVRLDWSSTPAGHVDLTGRARTQLSVRTEGGVDVLELVVTDTKNNEAAKTVPLAPVTGRQSTMVDLANLPNLDLASVRSFGLRWPQGREDGSGICLASVAFG